MTSSVSQFRFTVAERTQVRARVAVDGPSGSGKTMTGLLVLSELTRSSTVGEGRERIAVIDTESGSAARYAAPTEIKGVPTDPNLPQGSKEAGGFGFSHLCPTRFRPQDLIEMTGVAATMGFQALMIDSGTPFWNGPGGMLDQVNLMSRGGAGRNFDGWAKVGPIEREYLAALRAFPGHVFFTMRSKHVWDVSKDDQGRSTVTKLGAEPQQRNGIEYEFDIVGTLNLGHYWDITKTRASMFDGAVIHKPGVEFAKELRGWLEYGTAAPTTDWNALIDAAESDTDLWTLHEQAKDAGVFHMWRDRFTARKNEIAAQAAEAQRQRRTAMPASGGPGSGGGPTPEQARAAFLAGVNDNHDDELHRAAEQAA